MSKNVDGNSRFRYDLILWRYYTFKGTVQGYFGPQFFHNLNLRPLTNGQGWALHSFPFGTLRSFTF